MAGNKDVTFIRKNGKLIPIKKKKGDGGKKPSTKVGKVKVSAKHSKNEIKSRLKKAHGHQDKMRSIKSKFSLASIGVGMAGGALAGGRKFRAVGSMLGMMAGMIAGDVAAKTSSKYKKHKRARNKNIDSVHHSIMVHKYAKMKNGNT